MLANLVTKIDAQALIRTAVLVVATQAFGLCGFQAARAASTDGTPSQTASTSAFMPASRVVAATPFAYVNFCIRVPKQCERRPNEGASVALTAETWGLLRSVNDSVNDAIWPQSDEQHYHRSEYWTIPTDGYGDCDDYALTKQKQLIDKGLPEPALRLAIADTPRDGRHLVLTVATDRGDYVLDNLRNDIMVWNKTGYTWIERQDPVQPLSWVVIGPDRGRT